MGASLSRGKGGGGGDLGEVTGQKAFYKRLFLTRGMLEETNLQGGEYRDQDNSKKKKRKTQF